MTFHIHHSGKPRRVATTDGSRGFQPTGWVSPIKRSRVATIDSWRWLATVGQFMRRYATQGTWGDGVRGLKPTATIMRSLRDDGEPMRWVTPPRDIHSELADLNEEAASLAARIQENFEGLAV